MSRQRFFLTAVLLAGIVVVGYSQAFAQRATPLFAVLSGGNEVSNPTDTDPSQANVGDPNGYGSATIIFDGNNTVCYALTVNNIDTPTAAHIHQRRAGLNGPIVVNFTPPPTGSPGTSSDCVTNNSAAFRGILNSIKANPSGFYVNVHNAAFPGGAIRGNLF
jgi:hypothetical protein